MQPHNLFRTVRADLTGNYLRQVLLEKPPELREFAGFIKKSRSALAKMIIESEQKQLSRFNFRVRSRRLNGLRWPMLRYSDSRGEGGLFCDAEKHDRRGRTSLAERSVMACGGRFG
jgi:hypothetical protein